MESAGRVLKSSGCSPDRAWLTVGSTATVNVNLDDVNHDDDGRLQVSELLPFSGGYLRRLYSLNSQMLAWTLNEVSSKVVLQVLSFPVVFLCSRCMFNHHLF
ncbi:hypothetical protein ABHI18_007030 [Aspergillus niger]